MPDLSNRSPRSRSWLFTLSLLLLAAVGAVTVWGVRGLQETTSWVERSYEVKTLGPVTVSLGDATFPRDGTTPELLFELADASLYRAKAEGRDRVVHAAA
ncbi:diguanylate cyclase domain-containing protein [Luteimonas vadosa]